MKFSVLFLLLMVVVAGCIISEPVCEGCQAYKIVSITDGDTLEAVGATIRLSLVDAPEYDEEGYEEAKAFVSTTCPVGSEIIFDLDEGQLEGSYGRMIGVVYCRGKNLNEELLEKNHGVIDTRFCDESEFGHDDWALKFGCV